MTLPSGNQISNLKIHKVPDYATWIENYGSDKDIKPEDVVIFPPNIIQGAIDSKNLVYYGECSSGGNVQLKQVTIDNFPTTLTTGLFIRIKFTNAQTYSGNPQLQVNSTGAKNILSRDGIYIESQWTAGEVLDFVYDGTSWIEVNGSTATTTYYGITKLSSSTSSTSTTLAATPSAVKAAYDLANGKQATLISGTNIKTINNTSLLGSGNIAVQEPLPAQSSTTNQKFLQSIYNNGSNSLAWVDINALPDQTNHSGDVLTTDGEDASWATPDLVSIAQAGVDYQEPVPEASTAVAGIVQLSTSTSSTSTTFAATPSAVKTAYDRSATLINRSSAVNTANTSYTTLMARGESLNSTETTPAVNGAIAWTYE